jgi:hypothetical protein
MMSGGEEPHPFLHDAVFMELFAYIETECVKIEHEQLKNALSAAHASLTKYYSFTDDSPFYLLAVLLDPRFKNS